MASISDVKLEIVESDGVAAALVSYTLRGSVADDGTGHRFREAVQLIGVDQGEGEDGENEIILASRVFEEGVVFSPGFVAERRRLLALPSTVLDEDPGQEDEIQARVTLSLTLGAVSNVVRRTDTPSGPSNPVPA